jgi:hypothetical protein
MKVKSAVRKSRDRKADVLVPGTLTVLPSRRKLQADMLRVLQFHEEHPRVLTSDTHAGIVRDMIRVVHGDIFWSRGKWRLRPHGHGCGK